MNERRTLHPLYILFGIVSFVRGFLPLIIIAFLNGFQWSNLLAWYWLTGIAAGFALLIGFSYLHWRSFGFWLLDNRMIIKQGVIFREEKTIYYSRIHSVNVEQPLIQRLLGVSQLKIETPGGGKKADGVLHALSVKEAEAIKEQLRNFARATENAGGEALAALDDAKRDGGVAGGDGSAALDSGGTAASDRLSGASDRAEDSAPGMNTGIAINGGARSAMPDRMMALGPAQLMRAAATSLNFGLALAFLAGIYSFVDDFIELLLPDRFLDQIVEDSTWMMSSVLMIVMISLLVLLFAWVLSIVLYVLKYSGFSVTRQGGQVSLSYGLLEKKTVSFNPKNVQAVIIGESPLRQMIGYGEVKLQVVTSDKQEMLMLHPFIKLAEIQGLLESFVPGVAMESGNRLQPSPARALLFYARIPVLLAVAASAACLIAFGAVGGWSLLLLPLMFGWSWLRHRSAGLLLDDRQLTLRRRFLSRSTYLIVRPRILVMKVKRSNGQRRKELASVSVHALGSAMDFGVACMEQGEVEKIWKWFSRASQ